MKAARKKNYTLTNVFLYIFSRPSEIGRYYFVLWIFHADPDAIELLIIRIRVHITVNYLFKIVKQCLKNVLYKILMKE